MSFKNKLNAANHALVLLDMFAKTRKSGCTKTLVRDTAILINTPFLTRRLSGQRGPTNRFNGFPHLGIRNLLFCFIIMTTSVIVAEPKTQTDPLQAFKKRADKFHSVVSLPQFETTTNDITTTVKQTIASGNAALDLIGALKSDQVTFKNTVLALDDASYQIGLAANRLSLIKETSTNAALRDAATDAIKELQE